MCLFRKGSLGDTPVFFERLDVKEPEGGQTDGDAVRSQLPFLKEHRVIFANVPRAQAVRRTVEVSSKILDCPDVVAYGICREVTTLEFLQHHFSKMGHRGTSL